MKLLGCISLGGGTSSEGLQQRKWFERLFSFTGQSTTTGVEVKRLDHVYNRRTQEWIYKATKPPAAPRVLAGGKTTDGGDVWQSFCFVVVRHVTENPLAPRVSLTIKSPYLRAACKDVIGERPGLSWTADPLELSVDLLIAAYPQLVRCREKLQGVEARSTEEDNTLAGVTALLDYLREDHGATIAQIAHLLEDNEITYELLYAILVPGTLLVSEDDTTGELCAYELKSYEKHATDYALRCESLDAVDVPQSDSTELPETLVRPGTSRVQCNLSVGRFEGVVKINTLHAYPMKYHNDEAGLRSILLARARKWIDLHGVHHMQYKGTATRCGLRYKIDCRIMVDRDAFKHHNPNDSMPQVVTQHNVDFNSGVDSICSDFENKPKTAKAQSSLKTPGSLTDLPDDTLILASPVVYGFSLADKLWLEFNVQDVHPIQWSPEPFANLVLPGNHKSLLQSLVEAHNAHLDFDDFVQGKGQGLVINLFGPPGVGKTLSAEATSEHLRRPLYIIGGGDIGADQGAGSVDLSLKKVFSIATGWKAIVLIDEADVFLEQRSLDEMWRNSMVAVFLRHLEYYRGILFLTTNRVQVFDPAFMSRIHLALRFKELGKEAKLKIWQAFLQKVKAEAEVLTPAELDDLVGRKVNGRQIKNATKTATSLAQSRGEKLGYRHFAETLDAMEEFATEFERLKEITR